MRRTALFVCSGAVCYTPVMCLSQLQPSVPKASASTLQKPASPIALIETAGACVVNGCLSTEQIRVLDAAYRQAWRDYSLVLRAQRDSRLLARRDVSDGEQLVPVAEIRERMKHQGLVEASPGRYHLQFLRNPHLEDSTKQMLAVAEAWLPLVRSCLGEEPIVTEVQLVLSAPGSAAQMWHSDNTCGGLTVVVPLVDLTQATGWTQFHLGSHKLWPEHTHKNHVEESVVQVGVNALLVGLEVQGMAPIDNQIVARGDVVIFDARTLHRGCGNSSEFNRPILVFRYDRPSCPPPGAGMCATLFNKFVGGWLEE